jgi:hypothetical protein
MADKVRAAYRQCRMGERTVAKSPARPEVGLWLRNHVRSGTIDVPLISQAGGHLVQLASLKSGSAGYSSAWVTEDASDVRSLPHGARVFFGFGPAFRSSVNFVR